MRWWQRTVQMHTLVPYLLMVQWFLTGFIWGRYIIGH